MPLHIRDPRASSLARQLSEARGQTMTDAVIHALENELRRERERRPLSDRLDAIARRLASLGDGKRSRSPSRAEIDSLWGND